jgi:O-antigen/teichoic acid export membrane protein
VKPAPERHASSVIGARLVGGTIQVFAAEGLALPVGIAIAATLARAFGAAGYGVFALALSMVAAGEWVIGALFTRATIKVVGEASDWQPAARAALRWDLLTGVSAAALLWLAAGLLATGLDEPRLGSCLAWLACEIPFVTTSTGCRAILVGRGRFRARAVAGAIRWIARLAAVVLIVSLGFSIDGAAAGNVIGAAIGLVVARAYVGRLDENGHARRWSLRAPAGFWHVAVPTFVFAMSLRLLDKLGLVALKALGGSTADIGWYAAAQNFAIAPGLLAISFSPLLLASMSQAIGAGHVESARRLARNALRGVVAAVPFAAIAAGSAGEIVRIVYGPAFDPAAGLATPFLVAAIAIAATTIASAVMTAAGHARIAARCAWPVLPVAIMGYLVVVPRFGAMGAAVVTGTAAAVGASVALAATRATWRVAPPVATCLRGLVLSVPAYLAATWWSTPGAWWFLKVGVLGAGVAAVYLALGECSAAELSAFARAVRAGEQKVEGHV